jgi:Na+(H+)/acetate symporter ActP
MSLHSSKQLLLPYHLQSVICLIIASVTYVIGQMKGIGVAFSRFLEARPPVSEKGD